MSQKPLRVLLIAGSAERPSRIRSCLDLLSGALQDLGVCADIWDLSEQPLPLFDPRSYPDPYLSESPEVQRFALLADRADAFVLGSPVYHNSFSGVLKNALDSLSVQQFQNKPVALISSGHNDRTGSQPCDHLRGVVKGLRTVAIPSQIITIPSDFVRSRDCFILTNKALHERFTRLAQELVAYAALLRTLPSPQSAHNQEGNACRQSSLPQAR